MAFSTAELARIKHELGYNLLQVGADVYVGVSQLFETVVQNYIAAEVSTTSVSEVSASSPVVPETIVLMSATGFAEGDRVVVDVDSRRETVTIGGLSGTSMTALMAKNHGDASGASYPVSVEGPITIALENLQRVLDAKAELAKTFGEGAIKKVDELEFYDTGRTLFGTTGDAVMHWRDELASTLGVPNLWRTQESAGSRITVV